MSVDLPEAFGGMPVLGAEALSVGADGRPVLVGSCCRTCGTRTVPPTPVCPGCASEDLATEEQPREGTLYSYTVLHVAAPRWKRPLALGYVDLANGVRVFSHLDGLDWQPGVKVRLGMADLGAEKDGTVIRSYVFTREGAAQ